MKLFQYIIPLLLLASCAPKVDTMGYVNDIDLKEAVVVGTTTKDQVKDKLGSPSSQSTFGDEAWYYISDRKEAVGFLKPEITDQHVVRIQFNSAGVVSEVKQYSKDDAKDFAIAKRTTPTEGHELGFFEQLIGNIGRFNKPSDGSTDSAAPGRQAGH